MGKAYRKALIALEDGTCFEGRAFAGSGETFGELVFNTSMTGYQEILTDPSYHGQIVTLTYPLIGNYGINEEDMESGKPQAAGLVVGECSRIRSNWRSTISLPEYLEANGILGVDDIDTRAVTLHIRSKGAMKCVISTEDLDRDSLVQKAKNSSGLVGRDLSSEVSTKDSFVWPGPHAQREKFSTIQKNVNEAYDDWAAPRDSFRVAVIDCGIKINQLRMMAKMGWTLEVFPNSTAAEKILATKPDGVFISNGPGDPEGVPQVAAEIGKILKAGIPTFGICFGHQLIALALGGKTYKLKFGHRGGNQPVKDLTTGEVEITSQNHGFCVDIESLGDEVETTHVNLNDNTSEGLRHKVLPVFSVQYHPEACPGPHDSTYLFERFSKLMREQNR
ncbi:MAG: glutamine-hydrolyzing carbamoyl-phosphate synthase small subunit [Verrucomicrobia bacterium]|nr:glutamine-hydrolyzing carbamoyl-phosphate synthase small subunit [Verrucomicrobiota bacterium]